MSTKQQQDTNTRQGHASPVDGAGGRVMSKRLSQLSLTGGSDRSVLRGGNLQLSKINALRISINEHNIAAKILESCKVAVEKRRQIESALRHCKEAFIE